MKIGVPKEIKPQENRIGLTPDSVKILTASGHKVLIENNGGFEAGFENEHYIKAGAQIVNKALLHFWWFGNDYGDSKMIRTDCPGGSSKSVISPETACLIPYREIVRHYDAYSHACIDINACPPLFIPNGFFENKIKILYCSENRKEGYVHVNPTLKNYSTVDKNGAD